MYWGGEGHGYTREEKHFCPVVHMLLLHDPMGLIVKEMCAKTRKYKPHLIFSFWS
jgi:hypothetical protein